MKIQGVPGDYAFKALGRVNDLTAWELSLGYFFNQKEASKWMPEVVWPVTEDLYMDTKSVYVPAQEELE